MKKQTSALGLIILILIVLSGCASMPDFTREVNPIALFDENAAMYGHIKIEGNEDILAEVLLKNITNVDKSSIETILERSYALYVAVYEKTEAHPAYVQMALQGSFPTFIVNSSLKKEDGWLNHTVEIDNETYKYKQHTSGLQLVPLSSNLIALSTYSVGTIQNKYQTGNIVDTIYWPTAYNELGEIDNISTLFLDESNISLYIPKARTLVPTILQAPIELAIDYAYGTAKIVDGNDFTLDIQLKMENARIAKSTLTILNLITMVSDITVDLKDETMIILSNVPFGSYFIEGM